MDDPNEAHNWGSRRHVQTLVLMAATALGVFLCYRLAFPFLAPLVWALALAVLFVPFQRWMESKVASPSMAALLAVLVIALILVVPMTFVVQRLVVEAARGATLIESKVAAGDWKQTLAGQQYAGSVLERLERQIDLPGSFKLFSNWLITRAGSIVTGSVFQVVDFFLTFYMLFFFLRDRRAVLATLARLSPLDREEMELLCTRVGDTIHATVYGTLVVSAVQGLLGGLMFWWLGLPAPLLWGVIMALLALVPVLGAFVVWVPAVLFLMAEGSWGKAIILTLWGAVVVGTADNLLRPILVGKRLRIHTLLAFLSVIGGLVQFGPAGLILGPAVVAGTIVLLEIWFKRTRAATGAAPAAESPAAGPGEG
jgi:predicted PurR-regulated permease PerM